jgi:hypothetical protein
MLMLHVVILPVLILQPFKIGAYGVILPDLLVNGPEGRVHRQHDGEDDDYNIRIFHNRSPERREEKRESPRVSTTLPPS